MKTTIPVFLLSSTFLLSLILLGAADTAPSPVLDTDGEELRTGDEYYILPVIRGFGGGLTISSTIGNDSLITCDVVQEPLEVDIGLPLSFSPVDPEESVVRISTDLNIKFPNVVTICAQSTVWRLADYDESVGKRFVTTGGVEGNPGRDTLSNWFKIEEYDDDYKLVFCPTVCDTCRPLCGDIGVYIDENGRRLLVVGEEPLKVMFKKV